jgi:hypothetical protein
MTVRAFAEARGIAPATLYWWRARLRRGSQQAEMVPVEVVDDGCETRSGGSSVHGFELHLDESMMLRIAPGFDEAELRSLLRILRC